jgi:hypothetical protein
MENEIAVYQQNQGAVVNFEEYAMSKAGVLKQVQIIQEVMHQVMKVDEHYGTIPGTKKPSLYKPGAEKLSLTFRLRPEYDIRRSDLPGGHREYEVVCTLYHIPTGQSVGQGVGSATTMEGKYRFRPGPVELTNKPVPQEYWNTRNVDLLGGKGFVPKKDDSGKWMIAIKGEMVEHDNPADYYNTVLKMAKKRAHVDAILTATAASDIFTQDVEDMPEVIPGADGTQATQASQKKAPLKEPQKKQAKAPEGEMKTERVRIQSVESKSGDKNGKPYTIYTIIDENGEKYGTFDANIAAFAEKLAGGFGLAKIDYQDGKFGRRIESLIIEESTGTEG